MNLIAQAFTDDDQTQAAEIPASFRDRLALYAELENKRRLHQVEADDLQKQIKDLEEPLLNDMAEAGIQNVNCGGLTIYRRTDFYVSKRGDVPTPEIVDALRRHGLGYLVAEGYNANSLKSVIREWRDEERIIPDDLANKLNIGETVRLATRKA